METFGRFVVHESLATSEFASVHRAELPDVNGMPMQLALRRLAPGAPEPATRMFVDEAQLGMWLSHPNVARVYELANVDGWMFAAMEYVPGKTLAELAGRAAPVAVALAIVRQICDALAHVHGLRDPHGQPLGIVHGDLVAANVIVGADGIVKVGAFGRRGPGRRDARDDLFALGAIAYELLTARAPDPAAIAPPSSIEPRVPADIDGIVLTALASDPAHRWQYAAVLRDALVGVARASGLEVGPEQIAAWLREPPPAAPAPAPQVAAPAPPPVWVDDDDGATQISEAPLADVIDAAEAAAAAEIAALRAKATTTGSAPLARKPLTTGPTPLPAAARAPEPPPPAEPPQAPDPPPPDDFSEPAGKPRLPTELEMPSEGTQIGAKPLVSFGTAQVTALVGDSAPSARASMPVMPAPSGVSLPDPAYARRRRRMWQMIIAAAALIVAATIVLLVI